MSTAPNFNLDRVGGAKVTSPLPVSISSGGGGAATIADGADVTQGALADAAVTTDANGTLSGKLRGLVKILADIWDLVNHRIKVDGSGVTQPVSGTFWQATQSVSATSLPLPANAAQETGGNLAYLALLQQRVAYSQMAQFAAAQQPGAGFVPTPEIPAFLGSY